MIRSMTGMICLTLSLAMPVALTIPVQPVAAQEGLIGGAIFGGAAGAIIGGAAGGRGGAATGAIIGAATGAAIGLRWSDDGPVITGTMAAAGAGIRMPIIIWFRAVSVADMSNPAGEGSAARVASRLPSPTRTT